MGDRDDKPGWTEREKLSFSELDRRRRERRQGHDPGPRSEKARQRSGEAARQYLKQIDKIFSNDPGGGEAGRLLAAMREAHGTPGLAAACRAYRDALGLPEDLRDLALFLDADDEELAVAALEALRGRVAAGGVEVVAGLRRQIRMLAEDPRDAVAEAAEDLLAALEGGA